MKKSINLLLLVLGLYNLPLLVYSQKEPTLKSGDLLFITMDCGPLCEAIHAVTQGWKQMPISHLGLVVVENENIWVLEAAGSAVRKVTLEQFKQSTKKPILVTRVRAKYQNKIPDVIAFAEQQIGVPYDDAFLLNNQKYYCSELIYDAFAHAFGVPFFSMQPMTFKQPGSEDFFPAWVAYYQELGIEIPEGALGCNPANFSQSKKLKKIGWIYP